MQSPPVVVGAAVVVAAAVVGAAVVGAAVVGAVVLGPAAAIPAVASSSRMPPPTPGGSGGVSGLSPTRPRPTSATPPRSRLRASPVITHNALNILQRGRIKPAYLTRTTKL